MVAMLEVKDLSCGYGRTKVLEGVSFSLQRGELLGLIGPNGSGKTTLLRTISGYLPPLEGKVLLEGEDLGSIAPRDLSRKVAVVTQAPGGLPPFTVEEYVLLGRIPHWGRFKLIEDRTDRKAVERAMALSGVLPLRERELRELSGGELQLVFLARALAQEPELLLLDEPTAHLDIGHQVQIMDLLLELRDGGLTLLLVLHDLNLASLYCERLALLHRGRLHLIGSPWEVLREEVIEEVYGARVAVDASSHYPRPFLLPLPKGVRSP